ARGGGRRGGAAGGGGGTGDQRDSGPAAACPGFQGGAGEPQLRVVCLADVLTLVIVERGSRREQIPHPRFHGGDRLHRHGANLVRVRITDDLDVLKGRETEVAKGGLAGVVQPVRVLGADRQADVVAGAHRHAIVPRA